MKIWSFIGVLSFLCASETYAQHRIAFISDAHIQNIVDYPELVRSMEVQVQSTRLFNENYYALIAALEDAAKRGITLVVLPGDLTDNGQFVNQEKIKEILDSYRERFGMKFFVTTGNHDPVRPFGMQNEEHGFLRPDGSRTTRENRCAGYADEMQCYAAFGFYPQPEYLYWETPFTSYQYADYNYQEALSEGALDKRRYTLCDSLEAIDASYLVEPVGF
jgi:3',5'-cyclic AMP phosphodiesterase CpdA